MKLLFTLLLCSSVALSSMGQTCMSGIGGNVIVIDQDTTLNSFGWYWVCPGLTVNLLGSGVAWVESGCTVTVGGSVGNFSFKSNCVVTVTGTNHIVVYDNSTTVIDNSNNMFPTVCAMVEYDYTNAPAGGCNVTTSVQNISIDSNVSIYPNPATDQLNIDIPEHNVLGVRLIDPTGREVLSASGFNATVDVSSIPAGTYVVQILTDKGRMIDRVVIR